jgi:hypothetical protein
LRERDSEESAADNPGERQEAAGSFASIPDPSGCFNESARVFEQIGARAEQARTVLAWANFEREQGLLERSRRREAEAFHILSAERAKTQADLKMPGDGMRDNRIAIQSRIGEELDGPQRLGVSREPGL